ncbi:MAG: efflux RND transporter periplasmic adaptor subunit [Bryobacteraceae bacterium]|nr:efflux RND transporter periplasmic adaptor subunit [Bryobacteraceae bacterium]
MKKAGAGAAAGVMVVVAAAASILLFKGPGEASRRNDLPTAVARKGEFQVIVSCRGDLVAGRSVQVTAPVNVPNLQIVWMAAPGSAVKTGDPILRFDASSAERQLREKEAALKQAQASLEQAEAEARIRLEQDKLEVSTLKHAYERALLEVSKSEILSAIQAEEARVNAGLAETKLKVQQAALELNVASSASKIASLKAARDKVNAEVQLTRYRISQMEVRSPGDGIVSFQMNYSQGWMNAKPFKVGDNVWPGSVIAEIPDIRTLQLKAKVEEIERGRITPGQDVRIIMDPFPEKPFTGKLASISPLTEKSFEEWPPMRNFRAFGALNEIDPRLRPGMNGRLDIVTDRLKDAISVPARAVFSRGGRPVVLLAEANGLKPVKVEVLARNPDEVAVRGIEAGAHVALVDEFAEKKK